MSIRELDGKTPQIHPTAFVDDTALVVGDVVIGADGSLWPMSVARGDLAAIRIGDGTNVQDGTVLHVTGDSRFAPGGCPLHIGDRVTIGHNAVVHACTLGDGCLIGMGSTVLDGAVVGDGAMIAAHSLVPPAKKIEGGFLWMGSPVKKIRELTDEEREFLLFSARHYVELKNRHLRRPEAPSTPSA